MQLVWINKRVLNDHSKPVRPPLTARSTPRQAQATPREGLGEALARFLHQSGAAARTRGLRLRKKRAKAGPGLVYAPVAAEGFAVAAVD